MMTFKNKTALVTGASSGIGKAIAEKLAAAGCDLILVARNEAALQKLATTLQNQYGNIVLVIAADLTHPQCAPNIYQQIVSKNRRVDILINNAGFGTYGPFESIPAQKEQDEIAVNISALVSLTHAFIPGMLSRHSGKVLNIASTAAFQPVGFLSVYAATKAFVLSFSEALWAEYQGRGIHVAALCPPAVNTGFIDKLGDQAITKTSTFANTITPEAVAVAALKALSSSQPTHIVGLKNWLMAHSVRLAPRSLVARSAANKLRPTIISR